MACSQCRPQSSPLPALSRPAGPPYAVHFDNRVDGNCVTGLWFGGSGSDQNALLVIDNLDSIPSDLRGRAFQTLGSAAFKIVGYNRNGLTAWLVAVGRSGQETVYQRARDFPGGKRLQLSSFRETLRTSGHVRQASARRCTGLTFRASLKYERARRVLSANRTRLGGWRPPKLVGRGNKRQANGFDTSEPDQPQGPAGPQKDMMRRIKALGAKRRRLMESGFGSPAATPDARPEKSYAEAMAVVKQQGKIGYRTSFVRRHGEKLEQAVDVLGIDGVCRLEENGLKRLPTGSLEDPQGATSMYGFAKTTKAGRAAAEALQKMEEDCREARMLAFRNDPVRIAKEWAFIVGATGNSALMPFFERPNRSGTLSLEPKCLTLAKDEPSAEYDCVLQWPGRSPFVLRVPEWVVHGNAAFAKLVG